MMDWRCTAVSVQGQSHTRDGKPCQDAQGWAQVNNTLILACADGAGSARHAEWGSALAVETAISYMISNEMDRHWAGNPDVRGQYLLDTLDSAFRSAHTALADLSVNERISLRDLSTTLLLAVIDDACTAAAQVGDGAIVCSTGENGEIAAMTKPFQGQYINEAVFVTQKDYTKYLQMKVIVETAHDIALFSDGFEPVAIKYATGEPNPNLFSGLFRFMNSTPLSAVRTEAVTRLLTGKRMAECSDDDKTLVLATYASEANG